MSLRNYIDSLSLVFDPFEPGAPSRDFFVDANRQKLLDQLIEHSLCSDSIMAVTGCLGCGKSTLANAYCQSFGEEAQCALIPATLFMDETQFLEKLGEQFLIHLNEEETETSIDIIRRFASQQDLEAKALVIVIDDAHELSLEVLNLIGALLIDSSAGIHVLMLGEVQLIPLLQDALPSGKNPNLVEFELSGFGGEDFVEYARFKLATAGYMGQLPLSSKDLSHIYKSANGIPGTINVLISNALENSLSALPVGENAPFLVLKGNAYWAVAAVLIVLLIGALVIPDSESKVEQQSMIATFDELETLEQVEAGERGLEIPQDIVSEDETSVTIPLPASAALIAENTRAEEIDSPTGTVGVIEAIGVEALQQVIKSIATDIRDEPPSREVSEETAKRVEIENPEIVEFMISDFEKSLLDFPSSSYTVQIMGSRSETDVQRFVEEELELSYRGYFETRFQDKPWYVVVSGRFENRSDATQAIEELPVALKSLQPWVRALADIQSDIRQLNSLN
ncbi:MAG: AAA family ATPase [Gammaproteobacteria bacterium]|nr:AAA family ATPase [Gammaproteobacteria bacterium]